MRLLQVLASSDATITRRLILPMCIYTGGIYIEYLPLQQVVTVLDPKRKQNRRAQSHVWHQYTKGHLGYGKNFSLGYVVSYGSKSLLS